MRTASTFASAESTLLRWLTDPASDTGVSFAGADQAWQRWPYDRLAKAVRRTASGLAGCGVRRNDRVLIAEPAGPDFVIAYLATMLAGGVPAPIAPPALGQSEAAYDDLLRRAADVVQPKLVLAAGSLIGEVRRATGAAEITAQLGQCGDGEAPSEYPAADLAMLQLTSGSTGPPRAVRVTLPALESNVAAIGRWLRHRPEDPTASWLPLHHDMGLIGCLLSPLVHQGDLWLMSPAQFVRDPLRYLSRFGLAGARLSAMPTFGLRHILRRVRPENLTGMDFTQWRGLIVGAERVDAAVLDDFCQLLAPFGFRREALLPAYGLAEATLAVTGLPLEEVWQTCAVDASGLAIGGPVEPPAETAVRTTLVGCGRALSGVRVRIVDEDGAPLPDGRLGEIEVSGAGVTDGYLAETGSATRFRDGALLTGDLGFLHQGQLFVAGRLGDSLKLRGRTLFAEDVEDELIRVGMPPHRVAVLLGQLDRPVAVILAEQPIPEAAQSAAPVVRRLTEGAQLIVLTGPVGTIARTTSGKPRRQVLWQRFCAGELAHLAATSFPADERQQPTGTPG